MSYKKINFSQAGGFPLTQNILDHMQSAYNDSIAGIAKLCGNNVIISGMEDNGSTVTDGWILVDGQLTFFQGGPKQSTYIILEENTMETFEDGTDKDVVYKRYARFGSNGRPYTELFRLKDMQHLNTTLTNLNSAFNTLNSAYGLHAGNMSNPHNVTKAQVGLSNIPNAISDDPSLGRSDVLATTKATVMAGRLVEMRSIQINDLYSPFWQVLTSMIYIGEQSHSYSVFGSIHEALAPGRYGYSWHLIETRPTYFRIQVRKQLDIGATHYNPILFFNYLIMKIDY